MISLKSVQKHKYLFTQRSGIKGGHDDKLGTAWFRAQLQSSADGFVWAFEQIAPELRDKLPPRPGYLGTWPPIRHVWHVALYERTLVIPSMRQWLGGPPADGAGWTRGRRRR